MIDLLLRNATLTGSDRLDLAVHEGVIVDRGPGLEYTAVEVLDLDGRVLIPGFVESHVHLDIASNESLGSSRAVRAVSIPLWAERIDGA